MRGSCSLLGERRRELVGFDIFFGREVVKGGEKGIVEPENASSGRTRISS